MRDLIIVGAGGFGRETIDVVRAINSVSPTWRLLGVVDDSPSPANLDRLAALGVPHLGGVGAAPHGLAIAVAVGAPSARQAIVERLRAGEHDFPSLVHPTATIGSAFTHEPGLIVLAAASIGTNVRLGAHVHINPHAVIGHDATCHDYVSINPNAALSGDCVIGTRTLLGASSTVLQQLSVGRDVIVGAAACVVRDIADDQLVKGVPAR